MQGFKKCNNGHFYKESLGNCPYCPAGKSSPDSGSSTVVGGGAATSFDTLKTEAFGGSTETTEKTNDSFSGDRTMVFNPGSGPSGGTPFSSPASNTDNRNQFDRTYIGGMPSASDSNDGTAIVGNKPNEAPRAARKIVGWIISYTIDPFGVDYRIFEGNNTIGREPSNSIILAKESTISSKHATLLYRAGKFWIKDEMSANGSFLNDQEMEIQKAYELKDNDVFRLGNTIFRFKSAE
jgi:hypothetical protein